MPNNAVIILNISETLLHRITSFWEHWLDAEPVLTVRILPAQLEISAPYVVKH